MKARSFFFLAASLVGFLSPSARAQISVVVDGVNTAVQTKFTFWVDPASSRLTVEVDNRSMGTQHTRGTVTGFGFNLPTGDGADVPLLSQSWALNPAKHNTTPWSVVDNFQVKNTAAYRTDVGVWTKLSNPSKHGPRQHPPERCPPRRCRDLRF